MKWAFDLLGLPLNADATSIKRAYAKLLRSTRPDEDPEAFQRLHAAYKTALAQAGASPMPAAKPIAQVRENIEPSTPSTETAPLAAQPKSDSLVASPAAPKVNIGALAEEVIRIAVHSGNSRELTSWLQAREDFWSILIKQQTGQVLLHRLFQQPQTMSSECLDALLRFFDLDHVLSGVNPFALQQLRRRQSLQWELMPEHRYELAQRIQLRRNGRPDLDALKQYLDLLEQPLHWLRVAKTALRRGAVDRLGHFLQALCQGHINDLPASFDQRSVQFWYKATRTGTMAWQRFAINALRVTVIALVCALLATAVFVLNFATGSMPGKDALRFSAVFSFTIVGGVLGLWLLFTGWIYLDHWQGLPESAPERFPWLRRLIIPVLCIAGFALHAAGAADFVAGPLVFASFILALRRFRRRSVRNASRRSLRIGSMAPLAAYVCFIVINALTHVQGASDFPIMTAAVLITFGLWLADMWRHRAHLHPKFARG